MNSVLQQLYMIAPIRNKVLDVIESAKDMVKQLEEEDKDAVCKKNKEGVSKERLGGGRPVQDFFFCWGRVGEYFC